MPALFIALTIALLTALLFRALLRRCTNRYVDRRLIDYLDGSTPADPPPTHPALRDVTVLRTNLDDMSRRFTELGDQPAAVLLNDYRTATVPIIRSHGGVIVQFEFDQILALFGQIFPDDPDDTLNDHAAAALRTTLDLQQAMAELNATIAARGHPALVIRIGVATGQAHVGDLGPPDARFYTAIGKPVTLARELQRAARAANVTNLVSAETQSRASDLFEFREVIGLAPIAHELFAPR